ncbi:MAG: C4-type zinc ribbon domain-containing protein [Thermodesulfobacteriota bacterium]|nr:C4-type zinc ribbon domain-containing protein [Thermodesulfobacteriota bacterium]
MNIKEQIDILVKLQKIEIESEDIKLMLSNVSKKLDSFDVKLKEFEQSVIDKESQLNDLKKKYRSYESDAQMNLSQIKNSQEKLRAVKTNREYQSSLKEIEKLKIKNSQIEDEMLECLDRMDGSEKVIAARKDEYLKLKKIVGSDKEIIKQEAKHGEERLVKLEAEWNSVSSKVNPEVLKKYMTIKQKIKGIAIASVKGAVCNGCNMNLPPQLYNELQSCDTLKFCPNCQRIIYWEKS